MAPNMPSSTSFGARPSRSRMRAYSSGGKPRTRSASRDGAVSIMHGLDQRTENGEAIRTTQPRLTGALRVRHQPEHVAPGVPQAGHIPGRAVWIALRDGRAVRVTVAKQ